MLQNFVKLLGGDPNKRTAEKLADFLAEGIMRTLWGRGYWFEPRTKE